MDIYFVADVSVFSDIFSNFCETFLERFSDHFFHLPIGALLIHLLKILSFEATISYVILCAHGFSTA
jgi:hypothetical protein